MKTNCSGKSQNVAQEIFFQVLLGFIFFCSIISMAVAGWARHPTEMHVLGEIRLGGSHLGGVSEQPLKEEPCLEQADRQL